MSPIDISAINVFCTVLDDLSPEPVASSPQVAEELNRYPEKRLQAAMARVQPLPSEHLKLVMESMKTWYEVWVWLILTLETSSLLFYEEFQVIREDYLSDGGSL